jgi:hypothetical protein
MGVGTTFMGLPVGCGPSMMVGPRYYCGGVYYRPTVQNNQTVYIVDEMDAGASTTVEIEEPY